MSNVRYQANLVIFPTLWHVLPDAQSFLLLTWKHPLNKKSLHLLVMAHTKHIHAQLFLFHAEKPEGNHRIQS